MGVGDEEKGRHFGIGRCAMAAAVVAGSAVDICFEFEVGEMALDKGGALRVAWRWPFDWPVPGELVVACEAATVEAVFEAQGDMNPWHHHIELRVVEGELKQGDRMVLYCKGWDAPTFITYAARFLLLIKNVGEGDWMRLADPDPYDVVADAARRLVVIAEAEGGVGEEVSVRVWRGLLGQSGALGRGAGVGRGRCSVAAAFAAFSRV